MAGRDQPFDYGCRGCGHCCHHQLVRLNGYERQRLEAATGQSAQAFAVVRAGMLVLRQDEASGRCVFRSEKGCAVYADRPLQCRLYPLAREVDADGREHWRIPPPDPASAAVHGGPGTIRDFLGDDVEPYLAAADG